MKLKELQTFAIEACKTHPRHTVDILENVRMAMDEIDDGGSEDHECELAHGAIKDIMAEV